MSLNPCFEEKLTNQSTCTYITVTVWQHFDLVTITYQRFKDASIFYKYLYKYVCECTDLLDNVPRDMVVLQ